VSAQFTVLRNRSFDNLAVAGVHFHSLNARVTNCHAETQRACFPISRVRQCAPKTALTVAETKHHIEDFSAGPNGSENKRAVCSQCGCNAFDRRLCAAGIGIRLNCVENRKRVQRRQSSPKDDSRPLQMQVRDRRARLQERLANKMMILGCSQQ
jgi:hypothetical protein